MSIKLHPSSTKRCLTHRWIFLAYHELFQWSSMTPQQTPYDQSFESPITVPIWIITDRRCYKQGSRSCRNCDGWWATGATVMMDGLKTYPMLNPLLPCSINRWPCKNKPSSSPRDAGKSKGVMFFQCCKTKMNPRKLTPGDAKYLLLKRRNIKKPQFLGLHDTCLGVYIIINMFLKFLT